MNDSEDFDELEKAIEKASKETNPTEDRCTVSVQGLRLCGSFYNRKG